MDEAIGLFDRPIEEMEPVPPKILDRVTQRLGDGVEVRLALKAGSTWIFGARGGDRVCIADYTPPTPTTPGSGGTACRNLVDASLAEQPLLMFASHGRTKGVDAYGLVVDDVTAVRFDAGPRVEVASNVLVAHLDRTPSTVTLETASAGERTITLPTGLAGSAP